VAAGRRSMGSMKWALIVRADTVVVYGTNFLQCRISRGVARRWSTMILEPRRMRPSSEESSY
jgi:hypothetical protein